MGDSASSKQSAYLVGILVVSDSCASNQASDNSGLNLKHLVNNQDFLCTASYDIIPDKISDIKKKLIEWSDKSFNLILTTGGTGFSPRDVTPEATKDVIEKETTSLTNTILTESMKITKFAMLSRAISGIRNKTLIINLPGSKKGSQEAFEIILPVLKHALDLINDVKQEIKKDHVKIQSEHCHELKSRVCDKDILDKPRKSVYPMISVDEAIKIILDQTQILETESLFYLNALNRVSADDVIAQDPLPPFAASVKDGFALKLTNEQKAYLENKIKNTKFLFDVIGASNAGDDTLNINLKEGQCVKINTGAPVPLKCDLVVQIEDTVSVEKDEVNRDKKIEIVSTSGCGGTGADSAKISLKVGQDIRPVGFDIKKGEVVVKKGSVLKAAQIGICATVGALNLKVYKQPIVGLVSTGNELIDPKDVELNSGKIRDSNKSLLYCAMKNFGIDKIFDAGIASDNVHQVLKVFTNAMENSDVVISTGGVSMGDKDLVKDVLEKDFNATIHFARMNMKPGKPTTFATCLYKNRKKLIFALPGNPVSAIVTFNLVVVPCLKKMMGFENPFWSEIAVKIEFDANLDPRPEYHRSLIKWQIKENSNYFSAFSTGNQHSSRLLSMNEANALVVLPPRTNSKPNVCKGEYLRALLIDKI